MTTASPREDPAMDSIISLSTTRPADAARETIAAASAALAEGVL